LQVNEPRLWDVWSSKIWNKNLAKSYKTSLQKTKKKLAKSYKTSLHDTKKNLAKSYKASLFKTKKTWKSLIKLHFMKQKKLAKSYKTSLHEARKRSRGKRSSIIYCEWIFNNLWKLPTKACLETPTSYSTRIKSFRPIWLHGKENHVQKFYQQKRLA